MALEQQQVDQDLIYDDGEPMENAEHGTLSWCDLVQPLRSWQKRTGFRAFVGSNSPVGYERGKPALGPDLYVVNGGEYRGQEGWAPWREGGRTPTLVVEMLSPSTEARDRGEKMRIYRDVLKVVDYFLFQSETGGVEYYRLINGSYVRTFPTRRGLYRCASLPLFLKVVDGRLRWIDRQGNMLLNSDEVDEINAQKSAQVEAARVEAQQARVEAQQARVEAQQARSQVEEARTRAEAERQRAERLAERLRALGIDATAE